MTSERMQDFARLVTTQGHMEALERTKALRSMLVRLSKVCQRMGAPIALPADAVLDRLQAIEARVPATDFMRCALLVAEAEDIAREPLSSVDAALAVMFREQHRSESKERAIIKDAAGARSKSVKAADKALEHQLKLARARATREAHSNAVYSIWFQFITFGVVTGLIGALIAMRLPADGAQQEQGLLLALTMSFALPLALYTVAKCQSPGLEDWLRLAEEKEFARAFPRKEVELQRVRQAAVDAADQKYKAVSSASQREIASVQAGIDALNALQEHVNSLRFQTGF